MELYDKSLRSIFLLLLSCSMLLCFVGYGVYFVVIWRRRDLRDKYSWMTSLALSDVLFTCNIVPVVVSILKGSWIFGKLGGTINAVASLSFGYISIGGAMFISLDKLHRANKKVGNTQTNCIVKSWVVGLICGVLPYFGLGHFEEATENTFGCLLDLSKADLSSVVYIIGTASFFFIYPVLTMVSSYRELEKIKPSLSNKAIPLVFIAMYTPFAIHATLAVVTSHVPSEVELVISHIGPKILTGLNPLLYIASEPEILEEVYDAIFYGKVKTQKAD
uniref:G-protein coupled receptors family 1 profile domain-containing protein n=1 Tax=Ciona savignyi TaxID=51511 RepID=H2YM92_CIOSA